MAVFAVAVTVIMVAIIAVSSIRKQPKNANAKNIFNTSLHRKLYLAIPQ